MMSSKADLSLIIILLFILWVMATYTVVKTCCGEEITRKAQNTFKVGPALPIQVKIKKFVAAYNNSPAMIRRGANFACINTKTTNPELVMTVSKNCGRCKVCIAQLTPAIKAISKQWHATTNSYKMKVVAVTIRIDPTGTPKIVKNDLIFTVDENGNLRYVHERKNIKDKISGDLAYINETKGRICLLVL